MLNYIWFGMLVVGFIIGMINGNVNEVTNAAVESAGNAVMLCINLLGVMCLWSGLMKIAEKSGVMRGIARAIRPILGFLFPKASKNYQAIGMVIMNLSANILGLGNAATPLGLKAVSELQKLNPSKHFASDEIIMFLVLNTASLQLIPTSVIAIRTYAGSSNPIEIITTVWVASILAATAGIISAKVLSYIWRSGAMLK